MIKYFRDDSNDGGFDANALWAYEGIVLPGGQIILGRWWSPDDDIRDHEVCWKDPGHLTSTPDSH